MCNKVGCNFITSTNEGATMHTFSFESISILEVIRNKNADQSINFWSFATKFTHKDTTAQLTRLGQITTEIGLCRAWIRVALNDGIITSYVDALMADKKTLMKHLEEKPVEDQEIKDTSVKVIHSHQNLDMYTNPRLHLIHHLMQEILSQGFTRQDVENFKTLHTEFIALQTRNT
ncbi:PLEKHM1 [Mytilus edulis]|uniref:PLEKHM1 n=1 Tax=Mytilus edulis TaxID=6550 RepID=A0A8S3UPC4_MYTED|nr:PLEKHM1 [Mytilus edulis]